MERKQRAGTMSVIVILLYLLSFLVSWQFVGYPSLMAVVAIWARPKENDYSFQPFVSIVVPTQLLIKIKRVNK